LQPFWPGCDRSHFGPDATAAGSMLHLYDADRTMGREGKLRRIGSKRADLSVESSDAEAIEEEDGDDLSIFAPTSSAGGKQGRASQAFLLETVRDAQTPPRDAQALVEEADAAGGSSKEAGPVKATHRSGAKKRAGKRKSFVTTASHSGEDSEDSEATLQRPELMVETVKEEKCDLCGMKSTEQDPVAPSLAAKEGPNKMRSALLRWEKQDCRGGCCYYCARVHERRYGAKTRKQLKDFLHEDEKCVVCFCLVL
jgi:hypothetical protein